VLDQESALFLLQQKGKSQYENELYAPVPAGPRREPSFIVRVGILLVVGIILRTRT
jgi:hypothetical protein